LGVYIHIFKCIARFAGGKRFEELTKTLQSRFEKDMSARLQEIVDF
jgi:hypothetical protein